MNLKNIVLSAAMALNIASAPVQAAEIRSVPYRHFEMIKPVDKEQSKTLQDIVSNDDINLGHVKGVEDHNRFYNEIMQVGRNLGYNNIPDMDMKGFISMNSAITKYIIQAYQGKSQADDVPFEELINTNSYKGEDSFTGVCRHYADFVKEVFYATKHLNENVKGLECIVVGNKKDNHVWNMYLMQGNSGIISTETDVYKSDIGEEAWHKDVNVTGNPMDKSSTPGMFEMIVTASSSS